MCSFDQDSNLKPLAYQADTLPLELQTPPDMRTATTRTLFLRVKAEKTGQQKLVNLGINVLLIQTLTPVSKLSVISFQIQQTVLNTKL